MKILLDAPFNSLSLGNVSYNVCRELFEKGHDVAVWPTSNNVNIDAYNATEEFKLKFKEAIDKHFDFL